MNNNFVLLAGSICMILAKNNVVKSVRKVTVCVVLQENILNKIILKKYIMEEIFPLTHESQIWQCVVIE